MSRIDNLKKVLRNSGLLGNQIFDNGRELVFSDGRLRVLVDYYSSRVEILWLSESEFNSIKTRRNCSDFIKKTL